MASIIDNNNNTSSTSTNGKKKAAAFLNLAIIGKGDTKKNVGGLALYDDNPFHAQLIAHLKAGGTITTDVTHHIVEAESNFEFKV